MITATVIIKILWWGGVGGEQKKNDDVSHENVEGNDSEWYKVGLNTNCYKQRYHIFQQNKLNKERTMKKSFNFSHIMYFVVLLHCCVFKKFMSNSLSHSLLYFWGFLVGSFVNVDALLYSFWFNGELEWHFHFWYALSKISGTGFCVVYPYLLLLLWC